MEVAFSTERMKLRAEMDLGPLVEDLTQSLATAAMYGRSAARVVRRGRRLGSEERMVFVVGSPRSGTTLTGSSLGSLEGFVDLGEVQPWRGAITELFGQPDEEVAPRLRGILERVRRLGLARGLRGIEQSPETCFVLGAALLAYPDAVAVHVIRDGRDVVASLLEQGWLNADSTGQSYDPRDEYWVEHGREEEFALASDATRAAWAWRRHLAAAAAFPARTVPLRYEELVRDPGVATAPLAARLGIDADLVTQGFATAHNRSVGRWRRDLSAAQLSDVEREAGEQLRALGYH
jgi:sulfotransferase family protein